MVLEKSRARPGRNGKSEKAGAKAEYCEWCGKGTRKARGVRHSSSHGFPHKKSLHVSHFCAGMHARASGVTTVLH